MYLLPDRKVMHLFPREIAPDQFAICASEIINIIGDILPDVYFAVGVGDL